MNDFDDNYLKNLYNWKQPSKNKHNSKLNAKIKESDNIQTIHQWLRKVEDASETAINKVLNPKPDNVSIRKTKSNFNLVDFEKKNLIQIQDEICKKTDPFTEAHDLINQWVTDKIRLDLDDDFYNYVNVTEMNMISNNEKVLNQIKSELLEDDYKINKDSILDIKGVDYDKYDEDYITKDILNKIMKKNIVDPKKLLYTDDKKSKGVDMQLKLEMRHQAVKENREKRMKELEAKRREKLERKEIELKARQIVQKEENEKKMREDIEKQLIEQEAQKLRIEIIEQRKRDEELRKRERELEQIRKEREKQELDKIQKRFDLANLETGLESKRNEMAEKRAEDLLESFLKIKNMRLIQKSFSIWYGIILDARIKNGKAKALADWRLSYKVFNGWKKISVTEKVKKEQELHTNVIRNENIKNVKANNFYNTKLLQKFFEEWKNFIKKEMLLKQIESDKQRAKSRMQKFLEAAKEGKLTPKIDNDEITNSQLTTTRSNKSTNNSKLNQLTRSKSFENLSNENDKKSSSKQKLNNRTNLKYHNLIKNTNRSELSTQRDAIDSFNLEENLIKQTNIDINKKVKEMMWPLVKTPFSVNNFDNRFKAQEKLLNEQTKMIKEQQKLIEDLKYQQSQVAFKEQIALLEDIKAKQLELERMQKIQFKQEKKLLLKQAELNRNSKNKKNQETTNENIINEENVNLSSSSINSEDEITKTNLNNKETSRTGLNTSRTINTDNGMTSNNSNNNNKWDQFNKNMLERAKVREQLKKEREEKRKKIEMEKLELLKAQQEEKLKVEEEERRKKAEELKEKKRIQQQIEEKRNAEKIKEQQAITKAEDFYKRYLMRHYCLNGFKKLIEIKNNKIQAADFNYKIKIFKLIFIEWRLIIRADLAIREKKADDFYHKTLMKNSYFNGIKKFKQFLQIENAKASRFYKYNIKLKLFKAWKIYTYGEKDKYETYEIIVKQHNLLRIKTIYFNTWKEFPAEMKRSKARQKRLDELRNKVKQLIPDYDGPNNESISNSINSIK